MSSGNGSDTTDERRVAVLDLGTNTFNLLIGRVHPDLKPLHSSRAGVKLGKESIDERTLSEAAMERGVRALEGHLEKIEEWECDEVVAVATSGVRSAKNGEEFLEMVYRNTGLRIGAIDGNREADLIAEGVRATGALGEEPSLILDIGGGSSEFIIADGERTYWKESYDIGVARLLKDISPEEPIRPDQMESTKEALWEKAAPLKDALREHGAPKTLIGCSGSFESLAEMAEQLTPDMSSIKDNTWVEIDLSQFRWVHRNLLSSTMEQRLRMAGLAEVRAEMIVLGSILIEAVIEEAGTERLISSFYSLREGLLMETARKYRKE